MNDLWGILPPTVTLLELLWALPAVFGLARFAVRAVLAVRVYRRVLVDPLLGVDAVTGAELLALASRCLRFTCLTIAFAGFCVLALIALAVPPNPAVAADSPLAVLSAVTYLGIQVALLVKGEGTALIEAAQTRLYEQQRSRAAGERWPHD